MKRSRVIIVSALTLLTLVVQPLLLFAPAPKASALTEDEIKKQTTLYAYQRAMGFCVQKLENNINLNDSPGQWLGSIGNDSVVTVGLFSENSDGNLECQNLFTKAVPAFGYSSVSDPAFFKDLGYTCTVTTCSKNRTATLDNIRQIKKLPTSRTSAMSYFENRATFQKACAPQPLNANPPTAAQTAAAAKGQDDLIAIYEAVAGAGGTVTNREVIYRFDSSKSPDSDGAYDPARSLMSDGNNALSSTGAPCAQVARAYRDLSKSYVGTAVQQFGDYSKDTYQNGVITGVCGTATQPTDPMLRQEWQACKTRAINAFNSCYPSFLNGGTSTSGGNTAGGGGSSSGDVAQLASCVASKTGSDQAKVLTALQAAQNTIASNAGNFIPPSSTTSVPEEDTCPLPESASLRWAGCALFDIGNDAVAKLHEMIQQLLYVSINTAFSSNIQEVSGRFRNIGIGLILIAGLVMVVAQALSLDFVDAYTIRKVLPRLLVAMIGMALAWPLMKFAVTLFNDLGLGLDSTIGALSDTGQGGDIGMGSAITKNILEAVAGVAIVTSLGVMGILSLLWTVALALFLGLIVLSIRQVVIILCIVLAPFAIASYVLPGTQKIWGFWKNTFLTTLMMYPIIMVFLAAGRGAANIIGSNNTSGLMNIMAVLLYFAPYFMLPFAFKMAGGLMSTIFSIANDKERGLFDRAKKFRQGRMSKNWQDMRAGNRFKGKNMVSNRANRMLEGATNIDKAGFNPMQMRSKVRTALGTTSHDEATKFMNENQTFGSMKGDDAKLAAGRYTNRSAIEEELARFDPGRFHGAGNARARADAATQILQAQREAAPDTFQKARARAMAGTGTGYQYIDKNGNTQVDYNRMVDDINDAYGNDRNGAGRALAEMRGALTNSGHIAGQAGFGTWASVMERRNGYTADQRKVDSAESQVDMDTIMSDAINSANAGNALYGKPTSAAAMGRAHAQRIQAIANEVYAARRGFAMGTRTQDDVKQAEATLDGATAAAAGLLDAMGQAAPQNASAFANELMGKNITGIAAGGKNPTVRDMIDERMNNEEYRNRRRDYGSQATSQANAARQQSSSNPSAPGGPTISPGGRPSSGP